MDTTATVSHRRNGFDLDTDLMPIIKGKAPLPNFEELPLETGIAHIAAGGGLVTVDGVNNAKFAGSNSNYGHWARYWLKTTQGGALTGEGYVIFWDQSKGRVARFAICKHEKQIGAGARPERGWHPGHCKHCGLDMSVDSGD